MLSGVVDGRRVWGFGKFGNGIRTRLGCRGLFSARRRDRVGFDVALRVEVAGEGARGGWMLEDFVNEVWIDDVSDDSQLSGALGELGEKTPLESVKLRCAARAQSRYLDESVGNFVCEA